MTEMLHGRPMAAPTISVDSQLDKLEFEAVGVIILQICSKGEIFLALEGVPWYHVPE